MSEFSCTCCRAQNLLFYPVRNNNTKNVQSKFDSDELTTGSVLGGFRRPDGSDGVQDPRANTVEDAGYGE